MATIFCGLLVRKSRITRVRMDIGQKLVGRIKKYD